MSAVAEARETPSDIAALPPELLAMAVELYQLSQAGSAGKTFVELEEPILELSRKMGHWAIRTALELHPLAKPGQEHACPLCGLRFRILREAQHRGIGSRLGPISYNRPYGTCDRCEVSGAPMDWELGLSSDVNVSIGLLERVCHAAVVGRSFEDAYEIMKMHDMVDLNAKQIRALTESEGRRLAEQREVDAKDYREQRLQVQCEESPKLLVICADGGRVQTRQKERTERWKENKIGVVYDAAAKPQPRVATGEYQGAKAKTKTYTATMQPWESFGWMLRVEAEKRGYLKAETKLFLADGARHIREMKNLQFPEATFILDWAHAAEHVNDCAKAAFGEGSAEAKDWYLKHREMLWEGKRDVLIADIQKLSERLGTTADGEPEDSPRKVLRQNAYSYFPNNREAIDYPTFRSRGWPIGSGVVEAGVKQFAIRMKGSEKFWNVGGDDTETGAEEMLALCALYRCEHGRWQRHWRQRGQPRKWK
jgi:hypothetical protein